ncbi:ABC transporter substrate-binding protein [Brevibacillus migulae]|uniref:ABC transporter substrate-binding protein n=1 Tax=Brevibacillus migulae TaxID=1644114 RepID=UPI00106DF8B4|nr:ABC transporter substrate-binding protein [Brevibacillus migulae]
MKKLYGVCSLLVSCMIMITGCTGMQSASPPAGSEHAVESDLPPLPPQTNEKIKLRLWVSEEGWDEHIEAYERLHPQIEIVLTRNRTEEHKEKMLDALANRRAPDLMVISKDDLGEFTAISGLADLRQSPFQAETYMKDVPPALWQTTQSFDKQRMFAFPLATSPLVTYYRADILAQFGFPTEPEELARYMEITDNWLKMAKTLAEHGYYINDRPDTPFFLYQSTTGVFDDQLRFTGGGHFFSAYYLSRKLKQGGLDPKLHEQVEEEPPEEYLLRSGSMAMIYRGANEYERIRNMTPKTAGKWRVTRLPFDLNGWAGSSSISVSQYSSYKVYAWDFIQFMMKRQLAPGQVPAYLPVRKEVELAGSSNLFFGGQQVETLFVRLANQMKEFALTPLDTKVQKSLNDGIKHMMMKNADAATAITDIISQIRRETEYDRQILLDERRLLEGSKPTMR